MFCSMDNALIGITIVRIGQIMVIQPYRDRQNCPVKRLVWLSPLLPQGFRVHLGSQDISLLDSVTSSSQKHQFYSILNCFTKASWSVNPSVDPSKYERSLWPSLQNADGYPSQFNLGGCPVFPLVDTLVTNFSNRSAFSAPENPRSDTRNQKARVHKKAKQSKPGTNKHKIKEKKSPIKRKKAMSLHLSNNKVFY